MAKNNEEANDTLAKRLLKARTKRKLKQGELAKRAGLQQSDISKLENDRMHSTTAMARLAHVLQVPARWLELNEGEEPDWDAGLTGASEAHEAHLIRRPPSSLTPRQYDALYATLTEPERRRLLQLVVAGGFHVKGISVEVNVLWKEIAPDNDPDSGDPRPVGKTAPPLPAERAAIKNKKT